MPSKARLLFEKHLLKDVHHLMELHRQKHGGRGKPLAVLPRSGIFLLSAAWELYVEEAGRELSEMVLERSNHPAELPQAMQEKLAATVREKDRMEALNLAGDGWKAYYQGIVSEQIVSVNTPNARNIISLFRVCAGIDVAPNIGPETDKLSIFVKKRGDIAHQGSNAGHISIKDLERDYAYICKLVTDFDNYLIELMRPVLGRQPWNRKA